jgi:CDP-glucose 4,6-dehydratase
MTEIAIRSFICSYFSDGENVRIGIGRAGNVIGGGDWSADRIIPDSVKAWHRGKLVEIRSPKSTRPWQHVLEPLSGYLHLGSLLNSSKLLHGEAFNFGPPLNSNYSVEELIEKMATFWKQVSWRDTSVEFSHDHEAGLLRLNCEKAQEMLNWGPVLSFEETVQMTSSWYQNFYSSRSQAPNMLEMTVKQIQQYIDFANLRAHKWTN